MFQVTIKEIIKLNSHPKERGRKKKKKKKKKKQKNKQTAPIKCCLENYHETPTQYNNCI